MTQPDPVAIKQLVPILHDISDLHLLYVAGVVRQLLCERMLDADLRGDRAYITSLSEACSHLFSKGLYW